MKLNALDLNKLYVFCAVIELRGYRGASERLGLTRSAISQSITTLESQVGKPLFHRSGTRLVPTEAAKSFYDEVMRYQHGLESALDKMQDHTPTASGVLRVGAYLEFTKGKLMPIIESFLLANPRAQIQFQFDSPSRLDGLLERDRIDLAISIFPHRSQRIESKKLYQEELCLVGRRDLISENPSSSELNLVPIIDYFPSHLLFKRWWALHFKNPPAGIHFRAFAATADMVLEMVKRKLGVGVVPKYLLEESNSELHIIAPTSKKLVDHLWVNRPKIKKLTALEKSFLGSLDKALS